MFNSAGDNGNCLTEYMKGIMELKQVVKLEVTINEKTCTFSMPIDISFGNAIDAAHQIYKEVIDMARKAADKEQPTKGDE